jgi:hypothetical protein
VVSPDIARANGTTQAAVNQIWEGMRPHQFSDKQIAVSILSLIHLLDVLGDSNLGDGNCHRLAAKQLMIDPVEIEMGIASGSATRTFVASLDLWRALSEDGRCRLGLVQPATGNELMNILGTFHGATLNLFEPQILIDLFASIIVPWQVATKRSPICFSPHYLTVLGKP